MRPLFSLAVLLALSAHAAALDYYVDNKIGNDRYTGRLPKAAGGANGPFRAIDRALAVVHAGDRIVLANTGEPYRETIGLSVGRHSGSTLSAFTIVGNGAVLDGSAPISPGAWQHVEGDVFRFDPPLKAHQQLFLNAKPAPRVLAERDEPLPDLAPFEWCLHRGAIYFCVEQGKLPGDYPLTFANLQTGITLYQVHDVVITDLFVQGFQLDGINVNNGSHSIMLSGVTARGNGRAGVAVVADARATLDQCLLGDNGEAQLLTTNLVEAYLHDTDLLKNSAPAFLRRDKGRIFQAKRTGEQAKRPAEEVTR